ncbi:hypothetical protein R1flu_025539 [Riccia fluitans]|uniref:PHD-type zinc finger plants domain-containing protein n=1 Tax=Riccia fluitans TaxID=41844 RepID=A0ABD1XY16_9MARC
MVVEIIRSHPKARNQIEQFLFAFKKNVGVICAFLTFCDLDELFRANWLLVIVFGSELGGLSAGELVEHLKTAYLRMWGRKGKREEEQVTLLTFHDTFGEDKCGTVDNTQECSMCGDVGFPDHLRQCTRCLYRFQHTYCCNTTEGLGTGVWMCSWCQLEKDTPRNDLRESEQPPAPGGAIPCTESSISGDSGAGALEFLLKATLSEAGMDDAAAGEVGGGQSSSVDGGSICSSNLESVKGDKPRHGNGGGDPGNVSWRSNRERNNISEADEEATTDSTTQSNSAGACDLKRTRKSVRSNSSKSLQPKGRNRSSAVEQKCGPVQLKRVSSLKGGRKSGIACNPPRTFVRHYKLLSDISC